MLQHLDFARPWTVVLWAMVAGLVAGLAAASFHFVVTEPLIDDAIAIEDARVAAQDHGAGEPEQVSRDHQRGVGLFVGTALLGAGYGLFLAVTVLTLRGSWLDPFRRVLLAASILASAVLVLPWLKYPANPPAVGDPDTADERQLYHALLIALGAVLFAGVAHLSGRLRRAAWPDYRRIATLVALTAVGVGVVMVALPGNPDTIPTEVPAALIWRFRVASLGGNALLWGVLGLGFGTLAAEAAARRSVVSAASPAAAEGAAQNSMPFRAEIPLS